ncbi:MAG: ABC transporter permease [Candidatus Thermoplasmatota archaeon]|nr:ABC transporter permease [Candidatus Thermoplasmatota archaeon]
MVYVLRLAVNDFKNIIRDKFLVYAAIALPLMIVVLSQILVQWIAPTLEKTFPIAGNYMMVFMLFTTMIPLVYGFIVAFLILDERDEHLLTVLRVMPISRNVYLIYRMLFLSLFSFIVLLVFPPLSGLLVEFPQFSYIEYIPIALLFTLLTPFSALLVSSFATNKVQAFAIFKISGTVFIIPLFMFLLADNLKYIFAPIPNFWAFITLKELILTGANDYLHLGIGFVYNIALIAILFYIFNKKN